MAEAIAPLEFTGSDRAMVGKLALVMKGVAAVLLLLAVVNVVGGILTLVVASRLDCWRLSKGT